MGVPGKFKQHKAAAQYIKSSVATGIAFLNLFYVDSYCILVKKTRTKVIKKEFQSDMLIRFN